MFARFVIAIALGGIASGVALADGAKLYQQKTCLACHGKDARTPLLPEYPKIAGQNAKYAERQMLDIKSGARSSIGNSAAMKGVMGIVSTAEIKELAVCVILSQALGGRFAGHAQIRTRRFRLGAAATDRSPCAAAPSPSRRPRPDRQGIKVKGYVWNAQEGEKIEALHKKGDPVNGRDAYEVCGACHLPSGAGRPDGTFPQLAGQHTTVLIKQMASTSAPGCATTRRCIRSRSRWSIRRSSPTRRPTSRACASRPTTASTRAATRRRSCAGQGHVREGVPHLPRQGGRGQQGEVLSGHRGPALQGAPPTPGQQVSAVASAAQRRCGCRSSSAGGRLVAISARSNFGDRRAMCKAAPRSRARSSAARDDMR
ncbi:MAG: c-type cytochrome [Steroidobacteraceae bacterium]